jgi:NADH dehydrogenase FAD-containing subunit
VILYFYPKDDTTGCTKEACGFRDSWKDIQKLDAGVLGVSADDEASPQKFRAKYKLPFPLLSDPNVFGGGDCIAFAPRPLPRIGVHAVRQAPVLLHNLAASLDGRPLRAYRPQRRALLVLNLGDATALATWGPFVWYGHAAFRLKDRIDRRWLAASRA